MDYAIQYCAANCSNEPSWQTFTHVPSSATTISVTGLSATTTYSFRIAAVNTAGQGPWSSTTTGRPLFLEVSASNSVGLNITPSSSQTISSTSHTFTTNTNNPNGYMLQMGIDAASNPNRDLVHSGSPTDKLTRSLLNATNPGALPMNTWGYRVDGVDGFGNSNTTEESNQPNSAYSWAGIPALANASTVRLHSGVAVNDTTTVWYAANSSDSSKPGSYSATVTYTAVMQD